MNNTRFGNYAKLIAFFLVAVLLIVGFGFATEGWWQDTDPETNDDEANNTTSGEQKPAPEDQNEPKEPVFVAPEFVNALTGLEISEETSRKRHFAFVLDSDSPLYGISASDMVAEFPTENDETRLLAFINSPEKLSKIGSIAPTRTYISNIGRFFSSIIVYNGNDGSAPSASCDTKGSVFDMSDYTGYYYTEYSKFTYTNGDLINAGVYNSNLNTTVEKDVNIPYNFADFGEAAPHGNSSAKTVILPYSQRSETELYYQSAEKVYTFNKNGTSKNDTLYDKKITFKNVFVLFVDTVTYEEKNSTELVMKTIGSGNGFYISDGTSVQITWESDASGTMTLYNSNGEKLTVNRGNSYFGFVKSSRSEDAKIS